MRVGLFIPCYVDQLYPQVAIATLELLEKQGVEVVFPLKQTCCGQPMANSGFGHLTKGVDELFIKNFAGFDYIVSPSGSCVLHVKDHLHDEKREQEATHSRSKIYELTEFLTDVVKVEKINARFPYKVGMHHSCHGQRGLNLSQMTELVADPFSKPGKLLSMVEGLELVDLARRDECCGFGGTFSVFEEAVSAKMGKDRVKDHLDHGAQFITSADMSCLMHLEGVLNRQKSTVQVKHIAEILNSSANS
jgi:L-lactate dehydrogenase complex protein LldE